MKNTKLARVFALILILALSFSLAMPASAEVITLEETYVLDLAGLLSDTELSSLESRARSISEQSGVSVCILTVEDFTETGYGDAFDAASFYYSDFDLGSGDGRDGVLLLLSMYGRDYALYSHGERGEYAFNDYGLDELAGVFLDNFAGDDWCTGFSDYLDECGRYLELADAGQPVRKSPIGSIIGAVIVSCLIALIVCLVLKGQMKSVHRSTEASAYVSEALTLTESGDRYTHTTTTRRKISSDSSGHSGAGRSGHSGHSGSSGSGHSGKF